MRRVAVKQLPLFAKPPSAKRPRRGRPKKPGSGLPHLRRPAVSPNHPHHVTIRMREGTWNLRSQRCFAEIAAALEVVRDRRDLRVVHYSVQGNHLHFLIEADDRRAMSNGIRALLISMARRLNRLMRTSGSRYRDRFHERALTSPSSVRTALKYVLTNASHHHRAPLVDPYSSGPWFSGWAPVVQFPKWTPVTGPPTSEPDSWVLKHGWRRAGRFLA